MVVGQVPLTVLSRRDRALLKRRGFSLDETRRQEALLKRPWGYVPVIRPCTVGDGIERLSPSRQAQLLLLAKIAQKQGRYSFFVPASGAASRLFTSLFQLLHHCRTQECPAPTGGRFPGSLKDNFRFFKEMDRLALADPLRNLLKRRGVSLKNCLRSGNLLPVLDALLSDTGLGLPRQPKALIPFHRSGKEHLTAFDEHILEARALADKNKRVNLHFTVPPDFRSHFRRRGTQWAKRLRRKEGIDLRLSYSVQSPASDTLALDKDHRLARRADGRLLFRPGGHGALLSNLEKTRGDIVFIKNIDNVPTAPFQSSARRWRMVLAGRLLELRERALALLADVERNRKNAIAEAEQFIQSELGLNLRRGSTAHRRRDVRMILNRPFRVCAMVPNKGEPGGGPFWVKGSEGSARQIVELSQLVPRQKIFLKRSTHFNPVDMVVSLRDGQGRPLCLTRYRDPDQVIVSQKKMEGRPLRVLEHPGLWNGSMAGWNTVFVEVPHSVFHPVKTISDLLSRGHRGSGMVQ